jgi:uncharacterized secreted protein with C-terminal beta-propeller domain
MVLRLAILVTSILTTSSIQANEWIDPKEDPSTAKGLRPFANCQKVLEFIDFRIGSAPFGRSRVRNRGVPGIEGIDNNKASGRGLSKLAKVFGKLFNQKGDGARKWKGRSFRSQPGGSGRASKTHGLGGAGLGRRSAGALKAKVAPYVAGAPKRHTSTNNQVASVDEADVVKSNGRLIAHATGNFVHMVRSWPTNALRRLASIELEDPVLDILLTESQLVVISDAYGSYTRKSDVSIYEGGVVISEEGRGNIVKVTVFSISNPAKPRRLTAHRFVGSYFDARLVGGNVIMIATDDLNFGWAGRNQINKGRSDCKNIYRSRFETNTNVVSISKVMLSKNLSYTSHFVTGLDSIYVSEKHLYFAAAGRGSDDDSSAIHKVSIAQAASPKPLAAGVVKGSLINQFAMDEYNGDLRVATATVGLTNRVQIFRQSKSKLKKIGQTIAMADGEEIKSVRFLGKRGFVVTFRTVDPLFTLDLANPTNPKVLGELKIPGFSTYMHPIDDEHLLTVGKAADERTGREIGLKISVFSVKNMKKPKEVSTLETRQGEVSEANGNHHAFSYSSDNRTLALPVSSNLGQIPKVSVFKIQKDFQIKHRGAVGLSEILSNRYSGRRNIRNLFADNYLYSITNDGIGVSNLSNLDRFVSHLRYIKSPSQAEGTSKVVSRGLAESEVFTVIRANLVQIRHCYENLLARRPNSEGNLKTTFVIDLSGRVAAASVSSGTISDPIMRGCVTGRIKRWRFPKPRSSQVVRVRYPFVFTRF